MSGLARKFAAVDHSLNIFIMSMCRELLDEKKMKKALEEDEEYKGQDNDD
jgi:hypothetical protein